MNTGDRWFDIWCLQTNMSNIIPPPKVVENAMRLDQLSIESEHAFDYGSHVLGNVLE